MQLGVNSTGEGRDPDSIPICASDRYYQSLDPLYPRPRWWQLGRFLVNYWVVHAVASAGIIAWIAYSLTSGAAAEWLMLVTSAHPSTHSLWNLLVGSSSVLIAIVVVVGLVLLLPARRSLRVDEARERRALALRSAGIALARGYRAYLTRVVDATAAPPPLLRGAGDTTPGSAAGAAADAELRFAPLRLISNSAELRELGAPSPTASLTVDTPLSALDHAGHGAIAVVAPEGVGKTTLLRQLVWERAQEQLKAERPGGRVPLYLDLSRATLSGEDITESITTFVDGVPGLDHDGRIRITHALITGPSLLILDGLDDVRGGARDKALHHVNALARRAAFATLDAHAPHSPVVERSPSGTATTSPPVAAHPGARAAIQIAVGMRVANSRQGDLDSQTFESWELLPQTDAIAQQRIVAQMLHAWPAHMDAATGANDTSLAPLAPEHLLSQLAQQRESAAWASNPLLLSLATLGWAGSAGARVARTRVEVYHDAVQGLMSPQLGDWATDARERVNLLASRTALELFKSGQQSTSLQSFEREIALRLPAELAASQEVHGGQVAPGEMLLLWSGLFIPADSGEYVSHHASILTYLAALAIAHELAQQWPSPAAPDALLDALLPAPSMESEAVEPAHPTGGDLLALAWAWRTSARWSPLLALLPGIWCSAPAGPSETCPSYRPDLAHAWVRALLDQPEDVGLLGLRLAASSVAQITGDDEIIDTIASETAERLIAELIVATTARKTTMVGALQQAAACLATMAPGQRSFMVALAASLEAEDMHVRHMAVKTLGILGSAGAPVIAPIRPLLSDPVWSIRRAAADAVGALGRAGAELLDDLLLLLTDQEPSVRQAAAEAIGKLGGAGVAVVPALIPRLADPDASVRQVVVEAIGALGAAGAPALANLKIRMVDPSVRVRQSVAHALGALSVSEASALSDLRTLLADSDWPVRRAVAEAVGSLGPAGAPMLRDVRSLLSDADADVRRAAARAIGALGAAGATALPALRARLADPDAFVRQSAARAIGELGVAGAPALPNLRAILDDPFEEVRRAAAAALGALGAAGVPVLHNLQTLLAYPDADVRQTEAIRALGSAATQLLPDLLTPPAGPMEEVRRAAAAAIGGIAATGASVFPDLQVLLDDTDPFLRRIGAEAVGMLGTTGAPLLPGLRALLTDLDPDVRLTAVIALGKLGPTAAPAFDDLVALLSDPYHDVRRAAILAIGGFGPLAAPALSDLRGLLHDLDNSTREAAARAIGELGAAAAPALPDLLARLADQDAEVRHAAAVAIGALRASGVLVLSGLLARLTEPGMTAEDTTVLSADDLHSTVAGLTVSELTSRLIDADPFVRQTAADALGAMGAEGVRALPNVRALLADRHSSVRHAAAMAIGAMGPAAADVGPELKEAMADQEDGVARAATSALVTVQPDTLDTLLPELRTALAHGQAEGIFLPIAQRRELDLYLALGPAARPFAERIVALLDARHWSVRQGAARVLGAMSRVPEFALAALLNLRREDPYATVRTAASEALDTILSLDPDLPEASALRRK